VINHVCVCAGAIVLLTRALYKTNKIGVNAGRVVMKAVVIGWGQPYSHADTVDPHQLLGYREVLHV
jgi:hypothetical protein